MNVVVHRPHGLWQRHHPTARRIAAALLADPALLDLRARRLRADVIARYGVGACTARIAVAIARRARAADRAVDCASRETSRIQP